MGRSQFFVARVAVGLLHPTILYSYLLAAQALPAFYFAEIIYTYLVAID